jgi:prolipoprotein diacylglyceryltransferase
MNDLFFISTLGILLAILLLWGFRHLPQERWQMLAVVPFRKENGNSWEGTNLTYYGFFIATSQLFALALVISLLGSMNISLVAVAPPILTVLLFAIPAARFIAILVEKKRHTFTVGGASFVGIILAPFTIMLWQYLLSDYGYRLPVIPALAAMSIGYTLGEGLGRLACISFGCCYGKPVKDCNPFARALFTRIAVIFTGEIKKATYESQLAGEPLVPIQAITCVIYTTGALAGSYLFLKSHFTPALLLTISQIGRAHV